MKQFEKEVESNFEMFSASYNESLRATADGLKAHRPRFLGSYRAMVSLNAWQTELLQATVPDAALAFFVEARNDVLTSHVLASFGSWRSSLKSLRSCIENVLYSLYYKDHPVELELWLDGNHKLTFSDLIAYFRAHPSLAKLPEQVAGVDLLSAQFSILSRAVHGSAQDFRMSDTGGTIQLWSCDVARLGKWQKNERDVLVGLNRVLMALYRDKLQRSRLPNLRKAISLVFRQEQHAGIREHLGISLY